MKTKHPLGVYLDPISAAMLRPFLQNPLINGGMALAILAFAYGIGYCLGVLSL